MATKIDSDVCDPFTCSICLEILKNPVAIPCGHSFCMECVRAHWDNPTRAGQDISCPLCRMTFPVRPELTKNLTLCDLLERWQPVRQVAITDSSSCSEDVMCDSCTDKKVKAAKSCLVCMVSYCASHLQPHYRNLAFQSHQLVPPVRHIGNVCRIHLEPMEIFCMTDQICICQVCACQDHQDHKMVPAEQEKAEKEAQKLEMLKEVERQIQELDADITKTREAMDLIQSTALKQKDEVQKELAEASRILEKFQEEVNQFFENEEKSTLDEAEKYIRQLEVRHSKLKQQKQKVEQVPSTDIVSFIQQFQTLKMVAEEKCARPSSFNKQLNFTKCSQASSAVKDVLMKICKNQEDQLKRKDTDVDNQLARLKIRGTPQLLDGNGHSATSELYAFFLPYACEVELDPQTAERSLVLIGTKEVKRQSTPLSYPKSDRRFAYCAQVLGKKELVRSSFWEVEVIDGWVSIGVASYYLNPKGPYESTRLGRNERSWCICLHGKSLSVYHNDKETFLSRSSLTKLGVYLHIDDFVSYATLTFYDVRGTRIIEYYQCKIEGFRNRGVTMSIYPAFYLESVDAHLKIHSYK